MQKYSCGNWFAVLKLRTGSILKGRFEIIQELGEGGFATVYLGRDLELARDVALKMMKDTYQADYIARFKREARLMSSLRHKNIVSIFAFDQTDDEVPFIAMEYLKGRSLLRIINESGKLDRKTTFAVLRQICEGLSFAHNAGVVHRDISSQNIFLLATSDELQVKILDFGLSRPFLSEAGQGATLTQTGVLVGNPMYMSPETVRGAKADRRSDIYSLGCVLYEAITGVVPFPSDSTLNVIHSHQNTYPAEPNLKFWNNHDDEQLIKDIALSCLQKEPEKRFQDCQEILDALSSARVQAQRLDKIDQWAGFDARNSLRKKRLLIALLALVGLLAYCLFNDSAFSVLLKVVAPILPAAFEQDLAEKLIEKRRPLPALILLESLDKIEQSKTDQVRSFRCRYYIAQACMQHADIKGFNSSFGRLMQVARSCPDSKEKYKLLSRSWHFLDETAASRGLSLQWLRWEAELLDQMLLSKYQNRAETGACFGAIIRSSRKLPLAFSDPSTWSALARTCTLYVGGSRMIFSQTETDFLNYLGSVSVGSQAEEVERLMNARLAASAHSGEDIKYMRLIFAESILEGKPELASQSADLYLKEVGDLVSPDHNCRAIIVKAGALQNKGDYPASIKLLDEGWNLVKTREVKGYIANKLLVLRLRGLYHCDRFAEMKKCSQILQEQIWGENGVAKSAERLQDLREIGLFQSQWLEALDSYRETKQEKLIEKELQNMLLQLQKEHWQMNEFVSVALLNRFRKGPSKELVDALLQHSVQKQDEFIRSRRGLEIMNENSRQFMPLK